MSINKCLNSRSGIFRSFFFFSILKILLKNLSWSVLRIEEQTKFTKFPHSMQKSTVGLLIVDIEKILLKDTSRQHTL